MTGARREQSTLRLPAPPERVFAVVDDHELLSRHMSERSWRTAGMRMTTTLDEDKGRRVGSRIRIEGRVLGFPLGLEEVVSRRVAPTGKEWRTIGTPRLLVIGPYVLGVEIAPEGEGSRVVVRIEYELPVRNAWMGRLFGRAYARWCIKEMAASIMTHAGGASRA